MFTLLSFSESVTVYVPHHWLDHVSNFSSKFSPDTRATPENHIFSMEV